MDATVTCQGKTANGSQCTRSTALNEAGFCYQHAQQQQNTTLKEEKNVVNLVDSESVSNSNNNSVDGLPRCVAIAVTTKNRCKKNVSVAGEQYCPAHGGAQIKAKVHLPKCQALSQRNRTPCKNTVSIHGESFCSHHGGKAKGLRQVLIQDGSPAAQSLARSGSNSSSSSSNSSSIGGSGGGGSASMDMNWSEVQRVCLEFLLVTHPGSGCTCSPDKPCPSMSLVFWAQKAMKVSEAAPGKSVFGAPLAQLSTLLPEQNNHLFQDLYLAVKLFGNNLSLVPQLFHHIQRSFAKSNINNNNNANSGPARNLFGAHFDGGGGDAMDDGADVL